MGPKINVFSCFVLTFLTVSRHFKSVTSHEEETSKTCLSEDPQTCSSCSQSCSWPVSQSNGNFAFSLTELCGREFDISLPKPQGAHIRFKLCGNIPCNDMNSDSCITVPGIKPTSTGKLSSAETIEENVSLFGFKAVYDNGETCEVTKKPRRTIVTFPCNPSQHIDATKFTPVKAYEGDKNLICHYFIDFPPSQFGCPLSAHHMGNSGVLDKTSVAIQAGCVDSIPIKSTSNCHFNGGQTISIMGLGFSDLCQTDVSHSNQLTIDSAICTKRFQENYCVLVGGTLCATPTVVSPYIINCTLGPGNGEGLSIDLRKKSSGSGDCSDSVSVLSKALSYRKAINFKDKFSQFVEYGVGGLKKEIEELYRRAFASRGAAPDVLAHLGITHVKGILLYGPPGAGKTLLARAIAKMLGSKQVQLINGPEIISKYLGESERNLRSYFQEALDAYKKHGDASELYVIIIDEIEAICKPRGKSDLSAAGAAYDSLVNQLLTLMDGLVEVNNFLVIGMTNRRELMDSALLRPGRFEVQIEIGLPDEEGREEIFQIHTRSMKESGSLSPEVNCKELASNTTRFSGAEIAAVVRAAASYAIERQYSQIDQTLLVTTEDFRNALQSIVPEYTHSEAQILSQFLPDVFLSLGTAHESIITSLLNLIHAMNEGTVQTALIYGLKGTGKTSLAARVAILGHFTFVKVITAGHMIGLSDIGKIDLLHQTFKDALSSEVSLIVLDDLHRLVEYISVGDHISVSHSVMHAIFTLLSSIAPSGSRVLVIGTLTATNKDLLFKPQNLNFASLFTWRFYLPLMEVSDVLSFLKMKRINRLGGGQFSLPSNLSVSISNLLYLIQCICMSGKYQVTDNGMETKSCYFNSFLSQSSLVDCLTKI